MRDWHRRLLEQIRVDAEERSRTGRVKFGAHAVTCAAASIALLAALAALTNSVLIFPTLGSLAYTIFMHPLSPRARPREVVIGQWLGIGLGYVAALAFGLDRGSLSSLEADWRHVGSSSLALALTIAALLALRLDQSSACAVSLIVALGIWEAWELGVLAGAVLALLALGFLLNRAAGLRYPLWAGDLD
jgi:CBS domain-containing membrane protein